MISTGYPIDRMEANILRFDEGEKGFVRYTIQIIWKDRSWSVMRRFSDFGALQEVMTNSFPGFRSYLPPKKWFGR